MAKTKQSVDVTVAVPTFNGEEHLEELITSVLEQKTSLKFELLIIDSGSKDGTLDIIEKFSDSIKFHKIPNSEFGHGKTRNLAAQMANGEYIVYLSQDAIPASNNWLESMIEPFYITDKVVCVVGKQTPRPHTDVTTKREVETVFSGLGPEHSIMIHRGESLVKKGARQSILTFFSDVNSAVRIDLLLNKIPYRDVEYSEDQLLGKDVLDAGYLKAYAPEGNVVHSNDYPIGKYYSRRIDEYSAMYKVLGVVPEGRPLSLVKLLLTEIMRDYRFLIKDKDYSLKEKIANIVQSPLRNFEKIRASYVVFKNKDQIDKLKKHSLENKIKS